MSKEFDSTEKVIQIAMEACRVSYDCAKNTVEIRVTREEEEAYECGNKVTVGSSSNASLFPTQLHLILENIVSFDSKSIYSLLYSTLQDSILCTSLSHSIASEAKKKHKVSSGPLYIFLHVTVTQQRLVIEEEVEETCAICLEESQDLTELPNCSHVFHDSCIEEWLAMMSDTCPLCRTVIDID